MGDAVPGGEELADDRVDDLRVELGVEAAIRQAADAALVDHQVEEPEPLARFQPRVKRLRDPAVYSLGVSD